MKLAIAPQVWQRFPGIRFTVVTADGIDNASTPHPGVEAELAAAEEELRSGWKHETPQAHPRLAAWRGAFRALDVSRKEHASSVEALVRRVLGGQPLPRISPLVDLYNAVSLRYRIPAGGYDLGQVRGDLRLAFTTGGEAFHALGAEAPVTVGPGELAYLDDAGVLTRHFVWRQAERAKIDASTRRVFLVAEVLGEVEPGVARGAEADLVAGLEKHFGVSARSDVLRSGETAWDLGD